MILPMSVIRQNPVSRAGPAVATAAFGAARDVVGIRRGAISGNMKVSFQAARSIG